MCIRVRGENFNSLKESLVKEFDYYGDIMKDYPQTRRFHIEYLKMANAGGLYF